MAAATDNVGLFFGEDIFIAIGSILLMVGFLASSGITIDPIHLRSGRSRRPRWPS
jgi:uncharacterized membrane protein